MVNVVMLDGAAALNGLMYWQAAVWQHRRLHAVFYFLAGIELIGSSLWLLCRLLDGNNR